MKSPLSQSQLGVYYACVTNEDEHLNYQNPAMFDIPKDVEVKQVRKAVYEALCTHPYIASHIVVNDEGVPEMESGSFPALVIERDNRYTCTVLHRLGFHWSDTSSEYILQMLKQIAAFGFFE